jgi:hypothetical protein
MLVRGGRASSHLVRLVVGKRGTVPMRSELTVRFGHGGSVPWVTRSETGDLLAIAGPDNAISNINQEAAAPSPKSNRTIRERAAQRGKYLRTGDSMRPIMRS